MGKYEAQRVRKIYHSFSEVCLDHRWVYLPTENYRQQTRRRKCQNPCNVNHKGLNPL